MCWGCDPVGGENCLRIALACVSRVCFNSFRGDPAPLVDRARDVCSNRNR